MKKILLYMILFLSLTDVVRALPTEKEGLRMYSAVLKREVSYSIILPEGYDTSMREYPVLYLFHGIGGDYASWLEYGNVARVMNRMMQKGEIQPFIMVIPDGYLSYYSNTFDGSFSYETFFVKELIPYIDKTCRTQMAAASRSVMGFSMGGFGALSVSLRNRELFGSVVALSPSIRTESQYMKEGSQKGWDEQWGRIFGGTGTSGSQRLTSYYKEHSPYHILSGLPVADVKDFGIMLDIGDKEGTLCESNEELHELLLQRKISHEWGVRSGGHDFACWNAALPKAFRFINRYFEEGKPCAAIKKTLNEAPVITLATATIYYPEQAKGSSRKYPVIYVQGSADKHLQQSLVHRFHQMVNENRTWPAILCFIHVEENLIGTISDIEKQFSEIRASQRMRALITIGKSVGESIRAIQKENLFTGIVCIDGVGGESDALAFVNAVSSHQRYSRCWVEVLPELNEYAFSSRVHVLLQQSGMEHEFRSGKDREDNLLSHWENWITYLNNRIHV